jgi:phosphoglycolate phosphatase-like HAD superfamily hydrolase
VIFDVDGTLADSGKLGFDATAVILEKHGLPAITYEEYCHCTRYTTPERFARHIGLTDDTPNAEAAALRAKGDQLGQEFDDLHITLVSIETAGFFPGMLNLVENLPEHVSVGTLTNAAGRYAHAVLEANNQESAFDLYKRFGSILGADEVAKPKPHPDGLHQLCEELGVAPHDCVYIGDSPSDGVAAEAAGMPSVAVTWGAHGHDSLSRAPFCHVCRTVQELQSLLPSRQQ